MGDYSAYEGKSFDDGSGNIYTVTNGKFVDQHGKAFDYDPPVTTSQGQVQSFHMPGPVEAAKDIGTQLGVGTAETIEQTGTLPFGIANWTGKGMQAASPYVEPFAPSAAKSLKTGGQKLEEGSQPYTFQAQWPQEVAKHPFLGSEPQTMAGGIARNVPGAALGAATAGEGAAPFVARTLGSAVGGEAGQELTGSPWGQMAGALLGYGGVPTGPLRVNTPTAGMAQTLMKQGTPVSAAQRTGSGMRSLLEGGPPSGQMENISDNLLRQAGIVRKAGDNRTLSELANDRYAELNDAIKGPNGLRQTTSLPPANAQAVWNDLGNMDLAHTASGTGTASGEATSLIDPKVHEAYEDFEKLAKGGQPITGEQYSALSQKWKDSDNFVIKQMGQRLDSEMEKVHPEWIKWNSDYANYKGVRAAIDSAGGKATAQGIDPGVVNKSMYRTTDMKKYAEAAEGITSKYPEAKGGDTLSALAALTAAGAGYLHGGASGAAGAEAAYLPFALGSVQKAVGPAVNKLAGTAIGQKFLMMNPKSAAAALLGQQAVQPEGQVPK